MKRYIYALMPGVLIFFLFSFTHVGDINVNLRIFGRISFIYIALSLSVTPLLGIGFSQKLLPYRRVFGVLAFYAAIAHTAIYFYYEKLYSQRFFVSEHFKEMDILTGAIAIVLITVLGITSNNYSVNLLRASWKKLQTITYPLFLLVAIHIAFASRFEIFYMIVIGAVILLRTAGHMQKGKADGKIRYLCVPCGYIYDEDSGDPDSGIMPGTRFEDIPENWKCPVCGISKSDFIKIGGNSIPEEETFEFKVAGKKMLTKDVVELSIYSNISFFIRPGQFGKFIWKDSLGDFSRSYSVVSYAGGTVRFCIKIDDRGRGGKLLKALQIGDKVTIGGFFGDFLLRDTGNQKVFLATGTGLSPIIHMLNFAQDAKKTLYFGVREPEDVFYEEELNRVIGLDLNIFCSALKEDTPEHKSGRIDLSGIEYPHDTEFYICGNPSMITSLVSVLKDKGYKNIYSEKF